MRKRTIVALTVLCLALEGCGTIRTEEARSPFVAAVLRRNIVDVIQNTGTPSKYTQIHDPRGPKYDRLIVQWDFVNSDTAFNVTVPLLASVQIGGPGKCSMVATFDRFGGSPAEDVSFPQAHVDGWESDMQACGPLVNEDVTHPSTTDLPTDFDAFTLVGSPAIKTTDTIITK